MTGYDVVGLTIIVCQEKSIDNAYLDLLDNCELFLYPLHVKNNMGPILGTSKVSRLSLYEKTIY